jgi:hypothetical protein
VAIPLSGRMLAQERGATIVRPRRELSTPAPPRYLGFIPFCGVPLSKTDLGFVLQRVFLSEQEEMVNVIDGMLHDRLHLVVGDPAKSVAACTGGTGLAGVQILNWAVAERQRDDSLRFPGNFPTIGIDAHGKPHLLCAIVPQIR